MTGGAFTLYDFLMWFWLFAFIAFLVFVFILARLLAGLFLDWLSKSSPFTFKKKGKPTENTNQHPYNTDDKKNYSRCWFRDLVIFKRLFSTASLDKEEANPVRHSNRYSGINNSPNKLKRLSHTSRSIRQQKGKRQPNANKT
jgi:hypothetical protein